MKRVLVHCQCVAFLLFLRFLRFLLTDASGGVGLHQNVVVVEKFHQEFQTAWGFEHQTTPVGFVEMNRVGQSDHGVGTDIGKHRMQQLQQLWEKKTNSFLVRRRPSWGREKKHTREKKTETKRQVSIHHHQSPPITTHPNSPRHTQHCFEPLRRRVPPTETTHQCLHC